MRLIYRFLYVIQIGLFLTSFIGIQDTALASPKRGPRFGHGPYPQGRMVVTLPQRHRPISVGGKGYFYHNGLFYQKRGGAFFVVTAPIGAVLVNLPLGYATISVGGHFYYHYLRVYYQQVPGGYMVIEPPQGATVSSDPIREACETGTAVKVTANLLNVRSGPGKHFSVLYQVREGDVLYIHDTAPGWKYICTADAKYGWVMATFTGPVSPSASG